MADHYEVVTKARPEAGFGAKLADSIKGIFIGLILFVASFAVLWWGESRQNVAEFIGQSQKIESSATPSIPAKTLITTEGRLTSTEALLDTAYLSSLGTVKALSLTRHVQMYAWKEKKETKKEGENERTTYDYSKEWTSSPASSSKFHDSANHQNPSLNVEGDTWTVGSALIGSLPFAPDEADYYGTKDLPVKEDMLNKEVLGLHTNGEYLYIPVDAKPAAPAPIENDPYSFGSTPTPAPKQVTARKVASNPMIGDLRITYSYFPADVDGSLVGDWDGSKIVGHEYKGDNHFLGVHDGSISSLHSELQSEYSRNTWIIRGICFFMMWIGLNMLLGPVTFALSYIPVLGGLGRGMISLLTGVLSFVLWALTIFIARLWVVLLVLVVLGVGGILFVKSKKKQQAVAA